MYGDRLYDDRDALTEAVQELSRPGIVPCFPTAEREVPIQIEKGMQACMPSL